MDRAEDAGGRGVAETLGRRKDAKTQGRKVTYVRVWRFRPLPNRVTEFEEAYGPEGDWARLFRTADGFLGTTLLKGEGEPGEYLTLDRWVSVQAYEAFRRVGNEEFTALDRRCEALTAQEQEVGEYEEQAGQRVSDGS